jgi:hypothetical protein
MLRERTINVVKVSMKKPVKLDFERTPDKSVTYTGAEIKLQF